LFNPAYALLAATIWAFSPIYYRVFMEKFDFLSLNLLRMLMSASVLAVPVAYFGFGAGQGLTYAFLAGPLTLALGDSMFLLSIRETGASVSAPVVYTYVLMVQLVGVFLGQAIPYANFVAAAMVVAGVFLLSRGQGGAPRTKGIVLALGAGLAWTGGQELLQLATNAGGSIYAVTFVRNGAAGLARGAAFLLTRKNRRWPTGLPLRQYAWMAVIILSDLVVGSLVFVYSISTIGVAITVILTSVSPLLTQVASKALGKESPSPQDFIGGILVVAAVVLAVAF
jgi:drug/metabolite transporter, DME family